jgi:heme-degrading monooxygenase HmoA
MAVKRIWHGWTTPENAGAYRFVLTEEVLPGIEAKGIKGYRGIEVLQRDHESETEFITIMTFDSLQSVIDFQGQDFERCYVPDVAQRVLERWDLKAAHYEVVETRDAPEQS